MLADIGAQVTVIARPNKPGTAQIDSNAADNPLRQGKSVLQLDLKDTSARVEALNLVKCADALIEGHRPGVMERLGLGPSDCAKVNPRLVYGRMTGWGQNGPLAHAAGHDLNYLALTGILSLVEQKGVRPITPPTVVGDASGALGLAFGIASALFWARQTGRGCVVDAAIIDIVASVTSRKYRL
jgi:alpha-methylacyl-CoA racemase